MKTMINSPNVTCFSVGRNDNLYFFLEGRHKWAGIVSFLLCFSACGWAQVAEYMFSQSSGAYTAIAGGTLHGTSIDNANYSCTLPFVFTYSGAPYTVARPTANGFLVLGGDAPSASQYTPLSSGSTNFAISGLALDLKATVRSEVIGTAPNRVYVCQWSNAQRYVSSLQTTDNINFQIRLYETTNVIEVIYGSNIASITSSNAQVGLRGAAATDFNNRNKTGDAAWLNNTSNGTENSSAVNYGSASLPSSGTTFTWSPSLCASEPTFPSSSAVTCSAATIFWTSAVSAPGSGYEYFVSSSAVPPLSGAVATGAVAAGILTVNLTNLSSGTIYYYWIRSNCDGVKKSGWTSSANFTTLIANDFVGDATSISCGSVVSGTTIGATMAGAYEGNTCFTVQATPGVWYKVVGTGDVFNASLCATSWDSKISVFEGWNCSDLSCVGGNDDSGPACVSTSASFEWATIVGAVYWIKVFGYGSNNAFNLSLSCSPVNVVVPLVNDACANATNLPCGTSDLQGTTIGAVPETVLTEGSSVYGVWYSFMGDGTSTTISSVSGSDFDHELTFFSAASSGSTYSLVASIDNALAAGTETYTFTPTNGTSYYVYIAHFSASSTTTGTFSISRTCESAASVESVSDDYWLKVKEKEIASVTNVLGQVVNENYKGLILVTFTDGSSLKTMQ
jgi:hypothetical protein